FLVGLAARQPLLPRLRPAGVVGEVEAPPPLELLAMRVVRASGGLGIGPLALVRAALGAAADGGRERERDEREGGGGGARRPAHGFHGCDHPPLSLRSAGPGQEARR